MADLRDEKQNMHPGEIPESEEMYGMLHERLMERLERFREMPDEEIREKIDALLFETNHAVHIPLTERWMLRVRLFNAVRRLDILQELLDDDSVTEIMVNGTQNIFVERGGRISCWEKRFEDQKKLEDIVQQIAAGSNRVANEAAAIVDARLAGGERVSIVMNPIALGGPVITIRRFPNKPIDMETLLSWNSITREAAECLRKLVIAGYNLFISGGTGSGKTTFLNALSNYIPKDERIITIEDNAELQIQNAPNLVRLEGRRANEEGDNEVSIRDLIKASLRMRPDRIIVGEVRGDETIDMLQAMNTGHDGSLSTGHGNSPKDMLSRLEMMVLMGMEIPIQAVRRQIAAAIDIMVHLSRMRDRSRKVIEILEIDGYDAKSGEIKTHTLFSFEETGEDEEGRVVGTLVRRGEILHTGKLKQAGITPG